MANTHAKKTHRPQENDGPCSPNPYLESETMVDMDDIREQQEKSADTYATALKVRDLLEQLETDWGEEAAERALAIVTGDET